MSIQNSEERLKKSQETDNSLASLRLNQQKTNPLLSNNSIKSQTDPDIHEYKSSHVPGWAKNIATKAGYAGCAILGVALLPLTIAGLAIVRHGNASHSLQKQNKALEGEFQKLQSHVNLNYRITEGSGGKGNQKAESLQDSLTELKKIKNLGEKTNQGILENIKTSTAKNFTSQTQLTGQIEKLGKSHIAYQDRKEKKDSEKTEKGVKHLSFKDEWKFKTTTSKIGYCIAFPVALALMMKKSG